MNIVRHGAFKLGALGSLLGLLMGLAILWPASTNANYNMGAFWRSCRPFKVTLNHTGANQNWVAPSGCREVTVKLWGGGGGGGY